ncbi:MAG TPA: alpha/beta fold hydrolase [Caulobacteraceae bacterium]|jgi:pimeloyl-ACP methyl ester carboxylesterase|nr:alpha/beta fold hydrolase [Caulobacteraceae bacterium]
MTRKLVFLPGVGADPNFWRPLGERLPAAWQKVYLGWPGLGAQPPDPAVTGREDLLRLVEAAIGDGPADLLAQSMGGVLAIQAALRQPRRVRRLVLTVTAGGVDMAGLGAINWRETYRRENPQAPEWVYDPWGEPDIGQVRQPALLIWGDADPISPVAVGERLASLLPGATLRVVAGGDHGLAETHSAEIAPWIEAHLA